MSVIVSVCLCFLHRHPASEQEGEPQRGRLG
jgi:hypothetical protein